MVRPETIIVRNALTGAPMVIRVVRLRRRRGNTAAAFDAWRARLCKPKRRRFYTAFQAGEPYEVEVDDQGYDLPSRASELEPA